MIFSIQDKVTIITGGSSGIGAAAARRFVNAGANVCIASRRDSSAFADEIGAISIMCDVAKESDVRRLIEQVVNRFGRIDEIGRAHVCTPVTNAHLVCRLLLEK